MSLSDILMDREIFPLPARHVQEIVFQLVRALGCTFYELLYFSLCKLIICFSHTFKGGNSYEPQASERHASAFRFGVHKRNG